MLDEVFGESNFVSEILLKKGTAISNLLPSTSDFILLYARNRMAMKYRQLFLGKVAGVGESTGERYDQVELPDGRRRADDQRGKERIRAHCLKAPGSSSSRIQPPNTTTHHIEKTH